jgi:hypothetical protein
MRESTRISPVPHMSSWRVAYSSRNVTTCMGLLPKKCKAIHVTGFGGPYGFETSRIPYFLDNWLTDGGEVANLTRQSAALYPQEDSWYSFLLPALGLIMLGVWKLRGQMKCVPGWSNGKLPSSH